MSTKRKLVQIVKVTLLSHTPDPEKLVAAAAKLCYSPSTIDHILDGLTEEKTASYVQMLASMGHESVIEHISFTFGVEGVSRSLLAQLTRHRLASYSVQSQRYVELDHFEYVVPPEIAGCEEASREFVRAMEEDERHYDRLTALLRERHRRSLLAQGLDEKQAARQAEKQAIEDARFVLPNACTTRIVFTMNARSLMHFFHLRCCNRAQWEIRRLALEVYKAVVPVAPHIFARGGPSCVNGPCPEGKMNCGKAGEVRTFYRKVAADAIRQAEGEKPAAGSAKEG